MSSDPSIYSFGGYDYDNYYSDFDDDYDMSDDDDDDNPTTYDYSDPSTHIVPVQVLMFPESDKLKEYLKDGLFSDIIVRIGEKTYHLHRVVLSLKSAYFQKLFDKNFIEHNQTEVELRTIEIPIFDCIVKFIYENDLTSSITSENMTRLLIALDYLQIELDLTWFGHFIQNCENISMAHLFELFDFLIAHSRYPWLLSTILKYFSKNLWKISQTEYFLLIPFEYIKKILLYPQVRGREDEESKIITKICAKWICHDMNDRSRYIVELVNAIKYRYSKLFFLIDANLNLKCSDCDNKQKFVEKKLEELLNYSVEFIPGSCADWLNIQFHDSSIAPKNTVDMKQQMQELYNSADFSDVSIRVGIKSYPVHRIVLSTKSSYFHNLFIENGDESKEVELKEIDDYASLNLLLKYIYYQELEITSKDNIVSLMTASELFELNGITNKLESFVLERVNEIENIFELFSYLRKRSPTKLLTHVESYILDNWSKVTDLPNFVNLPLDVFKDIISISNLFAQEETDITNVCTKWVAQDVQNRLQYIPSIIPSLCRSMAFRISDDLKLENKKNSTGEKIVSSNLNRLLISYNPIKSIKPDSSTGSFKKPFFIASDNNQLRFFSCHDFKSLDDLNDLRLVLPGASSTVTSACAAVLDENLFVHFNDMYFYAQNLATKRCVSLTSDKRKSSHWNTQLLNCNGNVFLCHNQEGKVYKYSTNLNRWLTIPEINSSASKSTSPSIFASNGKVLYSISTERRDAKYAVNFYDEREKYWQALSDVNDMNRTYDYPISACFSNNNLFVAFSSFAKTYNFRNNKWSTVFNSSTDEYRHFNSIKPYKNNIFFVDKSKIHTYNISKKYWGKELINDTRTLQYLNVVHSI